MAYNPDVSFFIPFHELDPLSQSQCIFFTKEGTRCKSSCAKGDNKQAITLHKAIIATSDKAVSLEQLQKYAVYNCCRSGRPQHRYRIEDIGLLIPLAERWQDEIRRHVAHRSNHTVCVPSPEETYDYPTPARSSSSYTTSPSPPVGSPCYYQSNFQTSFNINPAGSETIESPSPSRRSSIISAQACASFVSQPRYDLRSREANIPANSSPIRLTSISQVPLAEFCPLRPYPRHKDTVSYKILHPVKNRDLETGSLYIFDRASSPGHVKIGWTAISVRDRLNAWSKCGYHPNLLFSVHDVPHAQRVETLTHYELIKEWRRERMCSECRRSHQEWFEISKERATQVLADWADFMKTAEPYDSNGQLKGRWKYFVETMERNTKVVTAKKLLEEYKDCLAGEARLGGAPVDMQPTMKTEELDSGYRPKVGRPKASKEAILHVGPLQIEQPILAEVAPLHKPDTFTKQLPLEKPPNLKAEKEPENEPLLKSKPKTVPLFETKALRRTQCLSGTETSFKIKPLSKTRPQFTVESLLDTEPIPKDESIHEGLLLDRLPVTKELLPEQIPSPASPSFQSIDTPSSQETKPSSTIGTEETGAIHTKITGLGTSAEHQTNSSVSPSALAALSVITSPSATCSGDNRRADTQATTYTTTKSPPLNFSEPSEPNPSDSSATSISPRIKIEPVSETPEPLVTELSKVLPHPSSDEQRKAGGPLASITHPQQNVEGGGQVSPESQRLGCEGQTLEEDMQAQEQDESTATKNEMGTGMDGWDADDTLVEEQKPSFLEKAALKIADEFYNELLPGKRIGF